MKPEDLRPIQRPITFPEVCGYTFVAFILFFLLVFLSGCASFSTTQTDTSYATNGAPQRAVTTKAKAWTFWAAKSSLATWKASQTDKSQGASVGGLAQEGNTTNLVESFGAAMGAGFAEYQKRMIGK